ncbi:MAG: polysaccharide deacetylase family protein [Candidatus Riflebacteria bacterium]|nr:polysaccharide deacetylase family protein [Candidatus Riflebacteria bacterium]
MRPVYVIYFHGVQDGPVDAFDRSCGRMTRATLATVVAFLQAHFDLVSLDEAMRRMDDPRAVTITFDDGYAGVFSQAAPLLAGAGVPATVFVVTGTLDDPETLLHYEELELAFRGSTVPVLRAPELGWPEIPLGKPIERVPWLKKVKRVLRDRPDGERAELHDLVLHRMGLDRSALRASPSQRKLVPEEIRALEAQGWAVGGHTRTHRVVGRLPEAEARAEIQGSRADLSGILKAPPCYFAYPYGRLVDVGSHGAQLVREAGFDAAFTTQSGPVTDDTDRFLVRRLEFIELMALQDAGLQQKAREAFGR